MSCIQINNEFCNQYQFFFNNNIYIFLNKYANNKLECSSIITVFSSSVFWEFLGATHPVFDEL